MKYPEVLHTDIVSSLKKWFITVALFLLAGLAMADDNQSPAQPAATPPATNPPAAGTNASTNAATAGQPVNALANTPAPSSWGGIGVGAIIGEPTGISMKGWLNERSAIDAGFAWSLDHRDSFHVHGDYLFHNFDLLPVSQGKLPVYFGVGGRVLFERDRDTRAGIRGPIGVAYMFEKAPVDIFVEIAPVLDLTPSTRFSLNGGIGIRYYFR